MEPINLYRFLMEAGRTTYVYPKDVQAEMESVKNVPKFMLPEGGDILGTGLKTVPTDIRLPFPTIVIEFDQWLPQDMLNEFSLSDIKPNRVVNGEVLQKQLFIVKEEGDKISLRKIGYIKGKTPLDDDLQMPGHKIYVPTTWTGTLESYIGDPNGGIDSPFQIDKASMTPEYARLFKDHPSTCYALAKFTFLHGVGAVLGLVEALACSNVTHEPLPVRKLNKSAAKRGALPFDEYQVLVINTSKKEQKKTKGLGGERHSPREHVRRGHIRTYESGKKIWVESMVVNGGIGSVINKDYKVK